MADDFTMPSLPTDPAHAGFASDNYAGVHPKVLEALAAVNSGYAIAYGDDPVTARLQDSLRDLFANPSLTALPVFNGTGANVTALSIISPRWGAVGAAASAHLNTDEGGAIEHMSSEKIVYLPTRDGKLRPADLDRLAAKNGDIHSAQVKALTISQSTEVGTLYTADELGALVERAHALGILVHVDGTRLWNTAVRLGCSFKQLITQTGVDILSLGATKVGAMSMDAVLVLNPQIEPLVAQFTRKYLAQLGSKQRFASIQLQTLLDDGLGFELARHANSQTERLVSALKAAAVPVDYAFDVEVNSCFPDLPNPVLARLRAKWRFYDWQAVDEETTRVRWMTNWSTADAEVDEFAADIIAAFRAC